jgi:phenylalanine-4-hydroxylase
MHHDSPPHLVALDPDHPGFRDPNYRRRRDAIAAAAGRHRAGDEPPAIAYSPAEQRVWRQVLTALAPLHRRLACRAYLEAARALRLPRTRIPQLAEVNASLAPLTGFHMEPVAGLVSARDFLAALGRSRFLSTQYVRHPSRPLYTPEPDVIHELVGHAATLADPTFVALNRAFGRATRRARDDAAMQRIYRLYWFTLEFGLVEEAGEVRAVGAGLLSSSGELERFAERALLRPFVADEVVATDFDPTGYQDRLFVAPSWPAFVASVLRTLDRIA